jgi:DNA-binding transcriptional ArsR family regulator
MKSKKTETQIANLLKHLSHPTRIRILFAIGESEACVCHMEAVLGYRQAYISQHLMELRKAGILKTNRDGKFIFYRIKDIQILDLVRKAASIAGLSAQDIEKLSIPDIVSNCCCPKCSCEINSSNHTEVEYLSKES